jgi:putative ABC transport system ATP-binding protein
MPSSENLIQLNNLKKSYRLGETVVNALNGINLKIQEAEFTALIGASGSGKSTLLNMIGCLDNPDSGEVLFQQTNIHNLNEHQKSELRNQKIGFIFQSFNLVPVLSVYENVSLPLVIRKDLNDNEKQARIKKAIEDVDLSLFSHHLPDQLSGGQRQRVAIARAIVSHPKLILADEPTANLDSKTAHMIIDLLLNLNRKNKVTFMFCSHDEKLIGRVDRVIRIQDGQIQL